MKTATNVFVLACVVVLACVFASAEESDMSSKLSPEHAKALLTILEHRAHQSPADDLRSFFEPSPYDHCCKVWDNLKCADTIAKCVTHCGTLESCIKCMGPLWEACCCCLDNAGVHIVKGSCPSCCN